MRLMNLIKCY